MAVPHPDDIEAIFALPFVLNYWPLIVGTLISGVFIFMANTRAIVIVAILSLMVQAWHSGLID